VNRPSSSLPGISAISASDPPIPAAFVSAGDGAAGNRLPGAVRPDMDILDFPTLMFSALTAGRSFI
jgi:hypothetical protein